MKLITEAAIVGLVLAALMAGALGCSHCPVEDIDGSCWRGPTYKRCIRNFLTGQVIQYDAPDFAEAKRIGYKRSKGVERIHRMQDAAYPILPPEVEVQNVR
jgi:hypothetical protein